MQNLNLNGKHKNHYGGGGGSMVGGIVPPGHFLASVDSGAPPRPNHHGKMCFYVTYIYTAGYMCTSYEVTKNLLVDEVCLCIFRGGLFCLRIVCANVAKNMCQLRVQLFNQFFVILQSTKGAFGVITDHHLWGLATTDKSPNANANRVHAIAAHICT